MQMKGNVMVTVGKENGEVLWLIAFLLFVSISITGCNNKEDPNAKSVEMLSEKQILKIAKRTAKSLRFSSRNKQVRYDVGKAEWERFTELMKIHYPDRWKKYEILNDRDYVIVLYEPKEEDELGDVLWLLIDRKTGEVILYEK